MYLFRDADLARRIGAATALEVRASGIHYTFAPCVAVSCYDSQLPNICAFLVFKLLKLKVLNVRICNVME